MGQTGRILLLAGLVVALCSAAWFLTTAGGPGEIEGSGCYLLELARRKQTHLVRQADPALGLALVKAVELSRGREIAGFGEAIR